MALITRNFRMKKATFSRNALIFVFVAQLFVILPFVVLPFVIP
jgi:hypothetical protein